MTKYMKWKYCSLLIFTTLFSSTSYAYSTDNHEFITNKAAELLQTCGLRSIDSRYVKTMAKYNVGQDDLTRKAILWHFPAPTNNETHRSKSATSVIISSFALSTDFSVWVEYLDRELKKSNATWTTYPALGALLHYVQDLAVPAHAVPIFHPVNYIPPHSDGLDKWSRFTGLSELEKECKYITNFTSTKKLLSNARNDTLENISMEGDLIYSNGSKITKGDWKLFWPKTQNSNGFGRYGCNKDMFGTEHEFICRKQNITVPYSAYQNFASKQVKQAIFTSAVLIYEYTQNHYVPSCEGIGCAETNNSKLLWLPNTKLLKKELGISY